MLGASVSPISISEGFSWLPTPLRQVLTQLSSEYFALRTRDRALQLVEKRLKRIGHDEESVAREVPISGISGIFWMEFWICIVLGRDTLRDLPGLSGGD